MDKMDFKKLIVGDPELGEGYWNELVAKASVNPVFKKVLKEGLYSDVAGALGGIQSTTWAAAQAAAIGRELITVLPTNNVLERFPKDIEAVAYEGEGPAFDTGERAEFKDVNVDKEPKVKKLWSESYVEDASWNVLQWQIAGIGRALARYETQKIDALYEAIAAVDLAGAGEVTIHDGAPTWAELTALIGALDKADFGKGKIVVAMNPHEFTGLLALDQFISALYLEPGAKRGTIYHTTLDVTFVHSSLIVSTIAINLDAAAVMLLRRDVNVKPFEKEEKFGVYGSERFGVGVLRNAAVARGTN